MKVTFLTLARYAELNSEGHVSMMGGDIDILSVPEVPTHLSFPLHLVFKIVFERDELDKDYEVKVRLSDPNEEDIFSHPFQVRPPEIGLDRKTKMHQFVRLANLPLAKYGLHKLRVEVAAELLHTHEIRVQQLQPRPQNGGE